MTDARCCRLRQSRFTPRAEAFVETTGTILKSVRSQLVWDGCGPGRKRRMSGCDGGEVGSRSRLRVRSHGPRAA